MRGRIRAPLRPTHTRAVRTEREDAVGEVEESSQGRTLPAGQRKRLEQGASCSPSLASLKPGDCRPKKFGLSLQRGVFRRPMLRSACVVTREYQHDVVTVLHYPHFSDPAVVRAHKHTRFFASHTCRTAVPDCICDAQRCSHRKQGRGQKENRGQPETPPESQIRLTFLA